MALLVVFTLRNSFYTTKVGIPSALALVSILIANKFFKNTLASIVVGTAVYIVFLNYGELFLTT